MLSKQLSIWYEENRRDLPWRRTRDPYAIWLSEIMLQQTTVRVVIPYFERFLIAFPTVESLAKAPEARVTALWSGLGYYSRARNLHQAAKQIEKLKKFPDSYATLLTLKGVGPYTSAAIASIAYGESVAVVDGNVTRVISRLFDLSADVGIKKTQREIQLLATELINGQNPSTHNQAMMELGATICVPKNPCCILCPVSSYCKAFENGTQLLRPVKSGKKKQVPWVWSIKLLEKNGRIAMTKSDNGTPWLKGTWVFPGTAKKLTGPLKKPWDLKHSITKHNIFVVVESAKTGDDFKNLTWMKPQDIKNFGVSSIVHKVLNLKGLL